MDLKTGTYLLALLLAVSPAMAADRLRPIMGAAAPEDLEALPGGREIVSSEMYGGPENLRGGPILLLDVATGRLRPLPLRPDKQAGWGDPACPIPPAPIGSHGIHLSRRADGKLQLLVVNHATRESIEFIEIAQGVGGTTATWRGCVADPDGDAFNDVAATPEGGFVASVPVDEALRRARGGKLPLDGAITGYLAEWRPGEALRRLPGSEAAFDNGVALGGDGRFVYFDAWTAREVRRYDRRRGAVTGRVRLGFMPDNLSRAPDGSLIAAGIEGIVPGDRCAKVDGACAPAFGVARIDPAGMTAAPIYRGQPGTMAGVSVALQLGRSYYLGSFGGNRIVRLEPAKKR